MLRPIYSAKLLYYYYYKQCFLICHLEILCREFFLYSSNLIEKVKLIIHFCFQHSCVSVNWINIS
jgi:hypothetical protein